MQSINVSAAREYCKLGANVLAAAVSFAVTGAYYTSTPAVTFSGGGGTGAAGTAIVQNGIVTGVTITNPGTGYTSAPTVAFAGGGSAAGTAVLDGTTVDSITMTSGGGKIITFTDQTTYASGEARALVQISLFDRFGNKYETSIAAGGGGTVAVTLGDHGLDSTEGIDGIATVVSDLRAVKDGSVYDIVTLKTTGYFRMEI